MWGACAVRLADAGCVGAIWRRAFSEKNIASAWEKTGCGPETWTRCVQTQLVAEEAEQTRLREKSWKNKMNTIADVVASGGPDGEAVSKGVAIARFKALDVVPLPDEISKLPDESWEDFARRLQEILFRVNEKEKKELEVKKQSGRYTSSKIWALDGGCTGDEAMAVALESNERTVARDAAKARGGERRRAGAVATNKLGAATAEKLRTIKAEKLLVGELKAFILFESGSMALV